VVVDVVQVAAKDGIMKFINLTPENVNEHGFFCVKNVKSEEFKKKKDWYSRAYSEGLRIKIMVNEAGKQIGYIEFVPAENAWRPIHAPGFMFIQCLFMYSNKDKNIGNGSLLIKACEEEAKKLNLKGVCTMTSKGTFIADKRLFEKNGFTQVDKLERFELMTKKFNSKFVDPKLIDWTKEREKYQGWHLLYADQCPWHSKSVSALQEVAKEFKINLNIRKLTSSTEAKTAPSGFGTFSLLHDGKLLEDHYLSSTRFKNILKKELH